MNRIWLDSYPPGVAADIDTSAYRSLPALLAQSAARYGARPALSCLGATLTYADLDRLSADFAAYLACALRLPRGARVAIMLPNLLQYPVTLFGVLRAGLVAVNVNPLYTPRELKRQLEDSGARAIVVLESFTATVESAMRESPPTAVIISAPGDLLPQPRRSLVNAAFRCMKRAAPRRHIGSAIPLRVALAAGRDASRRWVETSPQSEDLALLQYTGGTTGTPKAAMLTHGNIVANVAQISAWMAPSLVAGEETVVTALPLYHIFALTTNLLLFVALGGCNVLVPDARDVRALVRTLAKRRWSAITGVSSLYKALLDCPGFAAAAAANAGTLKVAVAGGMALEQSVAERWHAVTGVALIEGYGLTEASPVVCANRLDAPPYTGKLGLPLPSTEVRIDREDGRIAACGESGEICVRGPQVMRGYRDAPEETAAAFTPDGWLRTGDIGRMDERGYVEFVERRKDVIVVSGFKAYPGEIEAVVMRHPSVQDAAAVGMPDARSGEAVMLYVVRRDAGLTAEALREHCARHLTPYKRPRRIEFRDALPKSAIGKTLRRALRSEGVGAHG